jgi:heme A synthase
MAPRTDTPLIAGALVVAALLLLLIILPGSGTAQPELRIGAPAGQSRKTTTTMVIAAGARGGLVNAEVAAVLDDPDATPACRSAAERLASGAPAPPALAQQFARQCRPTPGS